MRLLRDRVFQGGPDVLLADQLGKRLRPVFSRDDLVHECDAELEDEYARPRVIRGTRTAPLPLLPSGPGGVCSRPLHGARGLTSHYLAWPRYLTGSPRWFRKEVLVDRLASAETLPRPCQYSIALTEAPAE